MAKKACLIRLKRELKEFTQNPPPYIPAVAVNERNILEWHYLIQGPPDTPFFGGWYVGKLKYPADYPFKPPAIMMLTPNGRFKTATRLCLSMSDYHPESWNPMWAVSTVLTGLLSFMVESTATTGSLESSDEDKKEFAKASLAFNLRNSAFRAMFPMLEEAACAAGLNTDNNDEQSDAAREYETEEGAPLSGAEEAASSAGEAATSQRDDHAQVGLGAGAGVELVAVPATSCASHVDAGQEPRACTPQAWPETGGKDASLRLECADTSPEAVESLIRQGDPEGALARLERLLTAVGPAAEASLLMQLKVDAQVALGELDGAVATLSENIQRAAGSAGIEGRPGLVELRASALSKEKGDKAFRRRKFIDALEHYDEARKLTPNCAPLHCNAAAALMAVGGKDNLLQALLASEKALALSRNYSKAQMRRADCLMGLGHNEDAAAQYMDLLQLYPDDKSLAAKLESAKQAQENDEHAQS